MELGQKYNFDANTKMAKNPRQDFHGLTMPLTMIHHGYHQ